MAKLDNNFPLYDEEGCMVYIEHVDATTRLIVRMGTKEYIFDKDNFQRGYQLFTTVGGQQVCDTIRERLKEHGAIQSI